MQFEQNVLLEQSSESVRKYQPRREREESSDYAGDKKGNGEETSDLQQGTYDLIPFFWVGSLIASWYTMRPKTTTLSDNGHKQLRWWYGSPRVLLNGSLSERGSPRPLDRFSTSSGSTSEDSEWQSEKATLSGKGGSGSGRVDTTVAGARLAFREAGRTGLTVATECNRARTA